MIEMIRKVEAGAIIFREGEQSDHAYLIEKGRVEITKLADEGTIRLANLGESDLLGEIGVLAECPRTATVRALEPTWLRVLPRVELLDLLACDESPGRPIALQLVEKLRGASALVTDEAARERLFRPRARPRSILGRLQARLGRDVSGRRNVLEFLPEIVSLEERPAPAAAQFTLFAIGSLIAAAVAWASAVSVDRVVTAPGEITTSGQHIVVQPMELGVIRDLAVTEGQVVRSGEVLATLDSTFAEADVTANKALLRSLEAEIVRLHAEITGDTPSRFSASDREEALQRALFTQRRSAYDSQLRALQAELLEVQANRARNDANEAGLVEQVRVVRELADMRRELLERAAGSRAQYLETLSDRLTLEQELTQVRHAEPELLQREAALIARREALQSEWLAETASQLQDAERRREAVLEELRKAERRRGLVQLTSPADAVVLDIAERSVGSVLQAAEPLFTLLPLKVPLEVELDVAPRDIGRIRVGDVVRVKLDALPFERHGTLAGRVRVISEDSLEKETPAGKIPVYRVDVDLTRTTLHDVPEDFRLIPGMTAHGEIKVGERRLITYFVYPIIRAVDESFREP